MELSEIIIGTKLNEIQKKSDDVKLVFEDTKTNKVYVLTFDGLLFERDYKVNCVNTILDFASILKDS